MTLEEIEKLCNEATPGPWKLDVFPKRGPECELRYSLDGPLGYSGYYEMSDAQLICALRNKAEKLIAVAKAAEIITKCHKDDELGISLQNIGYIEKALAELESL